MKGGISMLSEKQLLILNNLIYLDPFVKAEKNKSEGEITVGEILKLIKAKDFNGCCEMSTEEWEDIINVARLDKDICNLRVTNRMYETTTGAGMACFVDSYGQAYAVFKGTGKNEWIDNFDAALQSDSVQQEKALKWFNSLEYENIIVSGHSKGGNKAMYVTVNSDKAKECYAFDGEGFSAEFCEKYRYKISQKKDKIHLYSNYRGYVNILLYYIAGDVHFIKNDEGVSNFGEYHSPNALFKYKNNSMIENINIDNDGNVELYYELGEEGQQDPVMEMLHELTVYIMENATESEKAITFSVLGEAINSIFGGSKDIDINYIYKVLVNTEGFETLVRYICAYLNDLCINNPKKFEYYRKYLTQILDEETGDNKFVKLLVEKFFTRQNVKNATNVLKHLNLTNIEGRDFSHTTYERMMTAAKEVEDESWFRVDRWDCWYRAEQLFGNLDLSNYTGKVSEYYRKLIDINNASQKNITEIFRKVYELDEVYANRMNELVDRLKYVTQKLVDIHERINPR